ncbi:MULTISPECIES: glycosyltransferase [Providencia]|uniref:glycosyltransferase n=1 Tax=Providencia TaxID=586 RepID=UPI0015ECCF0A|nr:MULTISPECIES: glycosyltransferase [Providencia]QLQ65044.1 glycosyltransferase [Providencia rettgeri]URR21247.1 hypothetical protein L3Q80_12880 [Providencia rettgeri]WOB99666.1 glycosyltransferase [Providencia sp. PROV046]
MKIDNLLAQKFGSNKVLVYPKIEDVEKYNTYLRLLYTENVKSMSIRELILVLFNIKLQYDTFHFHWIGISDTKSFIATIIVLLVALKFRLYQKTVIWTLHNKYPHKKKFYRLNRYIDKFAAKISSYLHVHGCSAINIMSEILYQKKDKFFIYQHPNYNVKKFSKEELEQEREKIGLEKNDYVIIIPGIVHEYKRIFETLTFISKLDCKIIILGKDRCESTNYKDKIKSLIDRNNKIIWIDRFVSDYEMDLYHQISNLAVFNYEDILTSGSVIRSLNCQTITLAPNQGCLKDIKDINLYLFDNETEIPTIINKIRSKNAI